jgi:hypothetical protein
MLHFFWILFENKITPVFLIIEIYTRVHVHVYHSAGLEPPVTGEQTGIFNFKSAYSFIYEQNCTDYWCPNIIGHIFSCLSVNFWFDKK